MSDRKKKALRALSTSSFGSIYLPLVAEYACSLVLGARAGCVCAGGFHSWSWARCAVFRLDGLYTEAFSDPSYIYCIGSRENYYDRFKVPAVQPLLQFPSTYSPQVV